MCTLTWNNNNNNDGVFLTCAEGQSEMFVL